MSPSFALLAASAALLWHPVGALASAQPCTGKATERVAITNEDSHPHEIRPGQRARFYLEARDATGRVSVRCALRGPARAARLEVYGFEAHAPTPSGGIHPRGDVVITGCAAAGAEGGFDLVNEDPSELLWHQCYNVW